jgi:hypothetical protein
MLQRLAILVLLVLGTQPVPARADDTDDTDAIEPPVINRPRDFSGATGSYRVTMRAEPKTVQAEDPILLTLAFTGSGRLDKLARPDLRKQPEFARQFEIDNAGDRWLEQQKVREFDFRLRPRSAGVKQVPAFRFVYFKPGVVPDYLGYETTYAREIPIRVSPRAAVTPAEVEGGINSSVQPEALYSLVEGTTVLRQDEPVGLPGPIFLALGLLLPPAGAVVWYWGWRRRHPDLAQQQRRRRSRAAQQALKACGALKRLPEGERAVRAEGILTDYLRQRLDLASAAPTPSEVTKQLQSAGLSLQVGAEVSTFLGACTAVRFAPVPPAQPPDWPATAERLVLSLEAESW